MDDVRIGRRTLSRNVSVVLAAGIKLILPGNPARFSIVFCGPQAGQVACSTDPNVVALAGLQFITNSAPVMLTIQEHGDLVRQAWYAFSSGGATAMTIFETILQEGSNGES
jgi:hypothetical protein